MQPQIVLIALVVVLECIRKVVVTIVIQQLVIQVIMHQKVLVLLMQKMLVKFVQQVHTRLEVLHVNQQLVLKDLDLL